MFVDVPVMAKMVEVDYSKKLHCSTLSFFNPKLELLHIKGKAIMIAKVKNISEEDAKAIVSTKDEGYIDYRDLESPFLFTARQSLLSLCETINVKDSSWIISVIP
jgi:hypothetical protein